MTLKRVFSSSKASGCSWTIKSFEQDKLELKLTNGIFPGLCFPWRCPPQAKEEHERGWKGQVQSPGLLIGTIGLMKGDKNQGGRPPSHKKTKHAWKTFFLLKPFFFIVTPVNGLRGGGRSELRGHTRHLGDMLSIFQMYEKNVACGAIAFFPAGQEIHTYNYGGGGFNF